MTTPVALPSTQLVEKKARLPVSMGFSSVHSVPRFCGSDSPVSDELSTLKPSSLSTRMSAGTRSPDLTWMMSPHTRSMALISCTCPFRMHLHCCGVSLANDFMMLPALAPCMYEKMPVMTTTAASTTPR